MICAKCKERKATVHITAVNGDQVSTRDLCEQCAGTESGGMEGIELGALLEVLEPGSFRPRKLLYQLLPKHINFPFEAYDFVAEALENAFLDKFLQKSENAPRVSGLEMLQAIRSFALKKFEGRAKAALGGMKIFNTEDIGEIIFELKLVGFFPQAFVFSKEDFVKAFDFDKAFPEG